MAAICSRWQKELENEAQAEEEEESARPLATCQLYGADDSPLIIIIFGYEPLTFTPRIILSQRTKEQTKLVCKFCLSPWTGSSDFNLQAGVV